MTNLLQKELDREDICVQIQQVSGNGAKRTGYGQGSHPLYFYFYLLFIIYLFILLSCGVDPILDVTYKPETPPAGAPYPRPVPKTSPWMLTASLTALRPQRPGRLVAVCEPSIDGRERLRL